MYGAIFALPKDRAAHLGKDNVEQYARGGNTDNQCDKEKREIEDFAAGSADIADAPLLENYCC